MVKVGLLSLGCSKNQIDSEIMLGLIEEAGYTITKDYSEAEILIVNTCGFIADAKEESIESILDLAQYKEDDCKGLIVTGCLAQRYGEELLEEMPEIDGVLGTGNFDKIVEVIETIIEGNSRFNEIIKPPQFDYDRNLSRKNLSLSHMAYLKIAEGCNNCCTYCIIPKLRGPLKSRRIKNILIEARRLVRQGVKEINIIAQDITQYGIDLYGQSKLVELLEELVKVEGIRWIRLLYAYPSHITEDLLHLIAKEDKICNYLDLPIQHVNSEIRSRMNRGGSKEDILGIINKARRIIPDIKLRSTVIVGFPGEDEEQFIQLLEFIKEAQFDWLGAFTYSQEEGTKAAQMDCQIPQDRKEERYERIMRLQQEITGQRNQILLGEEIEVLLEEVQSEGMMVGRSEGTAPDVDGIIYVKGVDEDDQIGDMIKVKITDIYDYDLVGVKIQ